MDLLTLEERTELVDLLCMLPNIQYSQIRNSLINGLPDDLKNSIVSTNIMKVDVQNIVDMVTSEAWFRLPDGNYPIFLVIGNAIYMVKGSPLETKLLILTNKVRARLGLPPLADPPLQANGEIIKQGLKADEVEKNAINDKPIDNVKDDKLGFAIYVEALYEFITSQDTTTPLTISINGPWGMGKSSLMTMLKKRLDSYEKIPWWFFLQGLMWYIGYLSTFPALWFSKLLLRFASVELAQNIRDGLTYNPNGPKAQPIRQLPKGQQSWAKLIAMRHPIPPPFHPTIWFNAWKFSQEEQLWAALALETLAQLKQKYSFIGRVNFWIRLTRKRSSLLGFLWNIIKKGAIPLILGLVAVAYDLYIKQQVMHAFPHGYGYLQGFVPQGPYLLGAGAILSGLIQVASIAKDPFRIETKDIFDKPNYKDKLGFIRSFEDDFSRIVSVATHPHLGWKPQKLVIFIDDLDRCRPLQAVSIIEAISLFLDSKQCIFVIGMDPVAVTTSIEAKYKELAEKMRRETPEVVSPGSLFLDKIVQISLNVPRPTEQTLKEFVNDITSPKTQTRLIQPPPLSTSQSAASPTLQSTSTEPQLDRASFVHDDVREAINVAIPLLKKNPRQVKRFVNLFRLQVYIANKLEMLEERISNNQSSGLSLNMLAIWVAWSMQWPKIAKLLHDEVHGSGIYDYLADISKCIQDNGSWKPQTPNQGNGNQLTMISKLDEFIKDLKQKRKEEEDSPAHWCHLPWDAWILDNDFRYCLKRMENFWLQLESGNDSQFQHTLDLTGLITL